MHTVLINLIDKIVELKAKGGLDEAQVHARILLIYLIFRMQDIKQRADYLPLAEIKLLSDSLPNYLNENTLIQELVVRLVTFIDLACFRDEKNKQTYLRDLDKAVKGLPAEAFNLLSDDAASATVKYCKATYYLGAAKAQPLTPSRTGYSFEEINLLIEKRYTWLEEAKKQDPGFYAQLNLEFLKREQESTQEIVKAIFVRLDVRGDKKSFDAEDAMRLQKDLQTLFEHYSLGREHGLIDESLFKELLNAIACQAVSVIDKTVFAQLCLKAYESSYRLICKQKPNKDFFEKLRESTRQAFMLNSVEVLIAVLGLENNALYTEMEKIHFHLEKPQDDIVGIYNSYVMTMSKLRGEFILKEGSTKLMPNIDESLCVNEERLLHILYWSVQAEWDPKKFIDFLNLSQHSLGGIETIPEWIAREKAENPKLLSEYSIFLVHFEKVNARAPAYQQRNGLQFFIKYSDKIKQYLTMAGVLGIEYMQQLLANTVLPLEQMLETIPLLDDSLISPLTAYVTSQVKTTESIKIFTRCLFIVAHVSKIMADSGVKVDQAINAMAYNKSPSVFLNSLIRYMLNKILPGMGLQEIDEASVAKLLEVFPPEKLVNLIVNPAKMENDAYKEVYLTLLKMDLLGSMEDKDAFLHNPKQASSVGRALVQHNTVIREALSKQKINPKTALEYKKTYDFILLPSGISELEKNAEEKYWVFWNYLQELDGKAQPVLKSMDGKATTREEPCAQAAVDEVSQAPQDEIRRQQIIKELLSNLIAKIKQLRSNIQKKTKPGTSELKVVAAVLSDESNLILAKKIVNYLTKLKTLAANLSLSFNEFADHTIDQFELIKTSKSEVQQADKTTEPLYIRVEQWDKTRSETFYLGDEVGCCLATNGAMFQAIVQRRMDDAMLFHVAIDKTTGKPVALIWLYLANTSDNKIVLMANFFEVKTKFGLNEYQRKGLLNGLLQFTNQYLEDNPGIAGFYMNQLTYGWNKGDLGAYPIVPLTLVDKVGGPYIPGKISYDADSSNEESISQRQQHTSEQYYLVSLKQKQFYAFTPKVLAATKQETSIVVEELIQKKVIELFAKKPRSLDAMLAEVLKLHRLELEHFYDKPLDKNQRFLAILGKFYEHAVILRQESEKCRSSAAILQSGLQSGHAFFSSEGVKTPVLKAPPEAASEPSEAGSVLRGESDQDQDNKTP